MKLPAKVIFLVPGFPANEDDSTCIPALQNYIFYFDEMSPETEKVVIAFQYPFLSGKYEWHGIAVYAANGRNHGGLIRAFTWLKVFWYFFQVYDSSAKTVVHSFWLSECTLVGQWLARLFKVRQVATIMGQDVKKSNRYLKYLDFSKLSVTCGSPQSAINFRNTTGQEITAVISRGLDVRNFRRQTIPSCRPIDILGVGSLIPLKNYGLFLEIIAGLKKEFPGTTATIIGDGPDHLRLKQMIAAKNLEANVRLSGQLPRPSVIDYFFRSKILLHPSRFEDQAYVFMEALYCGLTIVCFNVGHAPGTEKIIICRDKNDMIARISSLLSQQLNFNSILLKSMAETVHDFQQLYRL